MREYCYNEQVNADERLSIIDIGEDLDPDGQVKDHGKHGRTVGSSQQVWRVKTLERIGESVKGRPKMEEMCLTFNV